MESLVLTDCERRILLAPRGGDPSAQETVRLPYRFKLAQSETCWSPYCARLALTSEGPASLASRWMPGLFPEKSA